MSDRKAWQPAKLSVRNRRLAEVADSLPDLLVVAAGYEPRCTYASEKLASLLGKPNPALGKRMLLLEFDTFKDAHTRLRADATFNTFEPRWRLELGKDDGIRCRKLVEQLVADMPNHGRPRRILVDYSSMSRSLYLCLLQLVSPDVELVFIYSVGRYGPVERDYPVSTIGTIASVPGLEGQSLAGWPKVHAIGLGFDGVGTRSIVETLEADNLVVFWADPGATTTAAETARRVNDDLVRRAKVSFFTSLTDVRATVERLSQLAFEVRATHKLVLVPCGPKPHVLASGLAAVQDIHCTLLAPHMSGGGHNRKLPLVEACGDLAVTTVRTAESV